jgi:hypothetical protein
MNIEQIFNLLLNIQVWTIVKWFISFSLLFYILFALIIVRQVNLMCQAIDFPLGWFLKVVAMVHFVGAIIILLMAIAVL